MTAANPINQPPVTRGELLTGLYKKAFPTVAAYISRRGGSFDEAKDVFHDALVIYYEKVVVSNVELTNDAAYLIGIAKHLWLKRYRENGRLVPLDDIDVAFDEADENLSSNRIMRFLETAGKKCMELLTDFYYEKQSLTDIAEKFGFSGTRSATVQKYKCLEKVRENIKEKALAYEDFME